VEYVLEVTDGSARVRAAPGVYPFEVQESPRGATKRDVMSPMADRPPGFFSGSLALSTRGPQAPRATDDGRFEAMRAVVNRARVSADSLNYLGMGYDRGVLRQGPLPDGAWERVADTGEIEVRLPWTMIGVTDPSSRTVMHGGSGRTVQVDDIRIVAATQVGGRWQAYPAGGQRADVAAFTWATWDVPQFRARRRPVFDAMRSVWAELGRTTIQVTTP
jgi:hypothetical protein